MQLSQSKLCDIAGISRGTRARWAEAELLSKGAQLGELDLIEAVVFGRLVKELGVDDARIAWPDIRPQLRALGSGQLDVVYDLQDHRAHLTRTADEVYEVSSTGRLLRILPMQERLDAAREAARRVGAREQTPHRGTDDDAVGSQAS